MLENYTLSIQQKGKKMGGNFVVSLDFELFWGLQDVRSIDNYRENIIGGKRAINLLLDLFDKYQIHATWAAVGMIIAKNEDELKYFCPIVSKQPTYDNTLLSPYRLLNDSIIKSNRECFFANNSIQEIKKHKNQEIGSHSFSHYYCREKGQTLEQFDADIEAVCRISEKYGINPNAFVFPRNQSIEACAEILKSHGFTSYRSEEKDWIHRIHNNSIKRAFRLLDVYFPISRNGCIPTVHSGIVCIPGTRMFKPIRKEISFLEPLKILRIKSQIKHAAQNNKTMHLWWHPHNIGVMTEQHLSQLEQIFKYYKTMEEKYGMKSLNMSELAESLLK